MGREIRGLQPLWDASEEEEEEESDADAGQKADKKDGCLAIVKEKWKKEKKKSLLKKGAPRLSP